MNTIRNIEAVTLTSIGALCVAAIFSLATQSAHAVSTSHAGVTTLPAVVIVGKRMTAEEKTALRAEMNNGHTML